LLFGISQNIVNLRSGDTVKSEEVRQPRSQFTAGRKQGVEIHGQVKGRVRRTQVLSWSIQYP